MSADNRSIEQLLGALKAEERSSPCGLHWQRFYDFLRTKERTGSKNPPVPLILAASGELDGSKHRRLRSQLEWASENGCLNEAIHYLTAMPKDHWNRGPLERWEQDSY